MVKFLHLMNLRIKMKDNKFKTKAIREGYQPTQEQEHSAAIFLTSSFRFDSAEQAAKRFDNKDQGNVQKREKPNCH